MPARKFDKRGDIRLGPLRDIIRKRNCAFCRLIFVIAKLKQGREPPDTAIEVQEMSCRRDPANDGPPGNIVCCFLRQRCFPSESIFPIPRVLLLPIEPSCICDELSDSINIDRVIDKPFFA